MWGEIWRVLGDREWDRERVWERECEGEGRCVLESV